MRLSSHASACHIVQNFNISPTQIHSETLKGFPILSVTSKVFEIFTKSILAQHLSYVRSTILRVHDKQVSYPSADAFHASPCLLFSFSSRL